jgi:hypothetical protein
MKTRLAPVLLRKGLYEYIIFQVLRIGQVRVDLWKHSRILQEFFNLWIVFLFDSFIINKVLLLAFMLHDLKAMTIKSIFVFIPGDVVD